MQRTAIHDKFEFHTILSQIAYKFSIVRRNFTSESKLIKLEKQRMISHAIKFTSTMKRNAQLAVLTFHRVLPEPDPLLYTELHAERFETVLGCWANWFDFVPLVEAVSKLRTGKLERSLACVTFDDGYVDNLEVAAPLLKKMGIPATFFVATQFSDGGMMFNDRVIEAVRAGRDSHLDASAVGLDRWPIGNVEERRAAVLGILSKVKYLSYAERDRVTAQLFEFAGAKKSKQPMMTLQQVKQLAELGFDIGAHTISHPILREIPDEQARFEITEGRRQLQELTGQKVEMFAYPNGRPGEDYDLRHVQMVKDAGFIGAVSTIPGAASKDDDLYQIPRFTPWHGASWKSGVQFLRNYRTPIRALKA
jgi:peptidoglycan/xylan/chitin deacetylase (PgdA/CDA1 family)